MPDSILDMRFSQNPEDPLDDDDFLRATYKAGVQVEKRKALKTAKEQIRNASTTTWKKDEKRDDRRKTQDQRPCETQKNEKTGWFGHKGAWPTKDAALKGVPKPEQDEYAQSREDCWCGGRSGHKTFECFSFQTKKGTTLPPAPWKVAAIREGKRKRSEEPEEPSPAKQQKIAAVETMETEPLSARWDNSESDF